MIEMKLQLARLTEMVESGTRENGYRFDHVEDMLEKIDHRVLLTNGRVTVLERGEAVRDGIARSASDHSSQVLTWGALGKVGMYGGWIVAGIIGFLRFIGKL